VVRIYHKVDGGYLINDVQKNNSNFFVNRTGFSKILFPLIKSGLWKDYNPLTGDVLFEYQYTDNRAISNKYWINDTTFINNVFWIVDESPQYQGGIDKAMNLIYANIDYPLEAKIRHMQGTVSIGFVVLKNGQIFGMRVLNYADKSLAKEAMRVVNMTSKNWIPGKIGNENVNAFMTIPITFKLQINR
ncbi:MAG TPA: energy transducer TonB, partial [Ignavibacteria bacterium]